MGTVTAAFARALASAAGLRLAEDGGLFDGNERVRQLQCTDGRLTDTDYFDLTTWIGDTHPDRVGLPFAYAQAVDVDNLGALGLAMKTAPRLRDTLERAERYFRLLTDTVSYQLDEGAEPALFILRQQTREHPALHLRNECALCGFGRIFKQFIGPDLSYDLVTFRHPAPGPIARYEDFFDAPVRFSAERNEALKWHPTVKPVRLVADAILDCTARGDIVLDTFLGSGSTLIAAEDVGRVCYGVEIDPLYVDLVIRRWEAFTGAEAVHTATGRTFRKTERGDTPLLLPPPAPGTHSDDGRAS